VLGGKSGRRAEGARNYFSTDPFLGGTVEEDSVPYETRERTIRLRRPQLPNVLTDGSSPHPCVDPPSPLHKQLVGFGLERMMPCGRKLTQMGGPGRHITSCWKQRREASSGPEASKPRKDLPQHPKVQDLGGVARMVGSDSQTPAARHRKLLEAESGLRSPLPGLCPVRQANGGIISSRRGSSRDQVRGTD